MGRSKKGALLAALAGSFVAFAGCGINIQRLLSDAFVAVVADQVAGLLPGLDLGGGDDGAQ